MKKQKNYFLILLFLSLILFWGHRVLGGDNLDGAGPSCPKVSISVCNGCNCAPQTVSCTCTRESDDACLSDCANSVSDCTANCSSASQDCHGDCAAAYSACVAEESACERECIASGDDTRDCMNACKQDCIGLLNRCDGSCNSAYGTCQSVCNSAYASCSSGCWYTSTNCPESSCSGPDDCCPPDDDDDDDDEEEEEEDDDDDDDDDDDSCTYVVCVNGQNQTRTGTVPCPADDPCPDEETCSCLVCNVNKKCRSKTYFGSACPCDDLCETDLECGSLSPTTTSKPPSLPCMITSFTINNKDESPIRVWVNQLLTAEWYTNLYCIDCKVDCSPTGCNWSQNNIGIDSRDDPHKFKITQKDTYTYTLTCWGKNKDEDTATLELTVKALSFPYWREIIPVLPGFLRGLFNR